MNAQRLLHCSGLAALLLAIAMTAPSVAAATTPVAGHSRFDAEEPAPGLIRITGKGPNFIAVACHTFDAPDNVVLVERHTRLRDADGTSLSLGDLKVPCTAKVELLSRTQKRVDPVARRIVVHEYGPNASAAFTTSRPYEHPPE